MNSLMKDFGKQCGIIHLSGIGGIGMSGIAQVLHAQGYCIQGSDIIDSPLLQILRNQGIQVFIGHAASHLEEASCLVVSSAISFENPEIIAAEEGNIPILKRAEMLAELMRHRPSIAVSGTHGKTTTTSLVATLLDRAQLDPTVISGGIINTYSSNVRIGKGDWMVVEADESDGTLVKLPATIGIVTNIDHEHMEFFKTVDALERAFYHFVDHLPADGLGILCVDHPRVKALKDQFPHKKILTYGFSPEAQFRAKNMHFTPHGMRFDVVLPGDTVWEGLEIALYGEHNVENALACIALAYHLGISEATLREVFQEFQGVRRRFTQTGTCQGVTVIDDYAHHPQEIRAVLRAAKGICRGRVIAVCQPHRYSRLAHLFDDFKSCFHDADDLILLPIYGAGETPLDLSSKDLEKAVLGVSGDVQYLGSFEDVAPYLKERMKSDDMIICLGAGSITHLAQRLPHDLMAA